MNKKILASMMVIGLLALAFGWGTYSWFSDTETSTDNVFTAGTIDLQLRNDLAGAWADGVTATWSAPNFAPGEDITAELRFKNIGTTGAWVIRICPENLVETDTGDDATPEIADKIEVTNIEYTEKGVWYGGVGMKNWFEGIFGDGDGVLTLRELVNPLPNSDYCMVFWIATHPPTEYYLPPNGARVEMLKMTFKFMEDAGNEYQGDSVSFDIKVVADQDVTISGKGSGCYGYK